MRPRISTAAGLNAYLPLLTVGLGVAFSKTDDRGLAEALSETLEEMHKDGTLKQILGKYLAEPERFMEVDGYEK